MLKCAANKSMCKFLRTQGLREDFSKYLSKYVTLRLSFQYLAEELIEYLHFYLSRITSCHTSRQSFYDGFDRNVMNLKLYWQKCDNDIILAYFNS